jgi:lipid-A-disaccharide synthase
VDLVLAVFPFEQEYFRSRGVDARYVGNPSLERLREVAPGGGSGPQEEPLVALLPGSRIQEVRRIFPRLLDAARYASRRCQARYWVVKAPDVPLEELKRVYRSWLGRRGKPLPLEFREEDTAQVLPRTDCAIIKSGTSTLEATLLRVPFAMVYRMSWPTWIFARLLVRTRTYSLTNLVMGERIVPEFIQWQARGRTIGRYLIRLLTDEGERASVRKKLGQAAGRLGRQNAYREAAMQVRRYLQE